MQHGTISERDNYLRTVEFRCPEWVPVCFGISSSAWLKYGEELEAVVLRHPRIFPDYVKGSCRARTARIPSDHREYVRDDWGCLWRNAIPGMMGQVVEHPLAEWDAVENLNVPDPAQQFNWREIAERTKEGRRTGLLTRGVMSIHNGGWFDPFLYRISLLASSIRLSRSSSMTPQTIRSSMAS